VGKDSDRPLRADAQRNRDKIVAAAVRIFDAEGLGVNFDRIAKEAGVGAGTLYRNFPTRESLVAAAYYGELGWLCDGARDLLDVLPAYDALRSWSRRLLDYATSKKGMADALLAMISAADHPFADSSARLCATISLLLKAGVGAGAVRADVTANDVLAAVAGAALVSGGPSGREQAQRLLDLVVDGVRDNQVRRGGTGGAPGIDVSHV
jgi:AcrR family transcriptional regulator